MTYFQRLGVNSITFVALSVILPNQWFHVSSLWIALLASFVLSILNMCVKPFLHLLSLPITLLTFGLFSFVINASILLLTSFFVGDMRFYFSSIWTAMLVSVIMSFVNSVVTDHMVQRYYNDY